MLSAKPGFADSICSLDSFVLPPHHSVIDFRYYQCYHKIELQH